jgi:hypothetical protein
MQDYYEVGRLRVCEKHKDEAVRRVNILNNSKNSRAGGAASGGGAGMAKAEKRRTRMINA